MKPTCKKKCCKKTGQEDDLDKKMDNLFTIKEASVEDSFESNFDETEWKHIKRFYEE